MKNLYFLSLLLLFPIACVAQWVPLDGPDSYTTQFMDGGKYVLALTGDGVFRSSDEGLHWEITPGLPRHYASVAWANNPDKDQLVIVLRDEACQCIYLYKSNDQGENWTKISTPGFADWISSIYAGDKGYLLASTGRLQDNRAIYTNWESFDGGKQWRRNYMDSLSAMPIQSLQLYGDNIWGFAGNQLFKGNKQGADWESVAVTPDSLKIGGYFVSGDTVLLQSFGSLYSRLWQSTDLGSTWIELPYQYSIIYFQKAGNTMLAIGAFSQFLASQDEGINWSIQSVDSIKLSNFLLKGSKVIAYEDASGVVVSDDLGKHFFRTQERLGSSSVVGPITVQGDQLIVGNQFTDKISQTLPVYNTQQKHWTYQTPPSPTYGFGFGSDDIIALDGWLFACMGTYETYRSADQGLSWSPCTDLSHWPDIPTGTSMFTIDHSLFLYSTYWYTDYPMYRSDDYGATWINLEIPTVFNCGSLGGGLVAGNAGKTIFLSSSYGNCLLKSEDLGSTWDDLILPEVPLQTDSGRTYILYITTADNMLLLSMARYERNRRDIFNYVSNNSGQTWEASDSPIDSRPQNALIFPTALNVADKTLMCAYGKGIMVSLDTGRHWIPFMEGFPTNAVHDMVMDDTYVYASTWGHGVWKRAIADLELLNPDADPNTLKVSIGPNPSTGLLRIIALSPIQSAHLEWFDMSGRLCAEEDLQFTCNQAVVELPFINGEYAYRLSTTEGGKASGKLILIR